MSKTERALDAEALDTDVDEFDADVRASDDLDAPAAPPPPPTTNGNGHAEVADDQLTSSDNGSFAPPIYDDEAPDPTDPPQVYDDVASDPSEPRQVSDDVASDPSAAPLDQEQPTEVVEGADSDEIEAPASADASATEVDDRAVENDDRPDGFVGPEPSEDVLEELRRADIDGPTVKMAPHDDSTAARRRPRRLPEYDPAPIPIPTKVPRVLGRKPRVRKVTRVVRSVDPWSVFKIAIIASLVLYIIALTSGVLLWNVAYATGTIDNVERFFESFGWSSFEFNGGEIFHSAWIGGLFAALGLTGLAVLGAALFNLITDLVGGVRLTVLEEEVVETRTSPMRRFVVRRPAPEVPAMEDDESGALMREAIVDDSGTIVRRTR